MLATRLLLQAFGASTASTFVDFVYNITRTLVAPFFGIFASTPTNGGARFEIETTVAMLFYALIAYLVTGLLKTVRT